MSPRKSTSSVAEASSHEEEQQAAAESSKTAGSGTDPIETGVNVEDYLLPRSLTQRLAKSVLPPNTSIQKDALLAISKAATVFVSYLSSHANEETEKKTITPQDVFAALSQIEFDAFLPRLERELAVYTEAAAEKRRGKKDRKSGAATTAATMGIETGAGAVGNVGAASPADGAGNVEDGIEPGAKRLKRGGEGATEMAIRRSRSGIGNGGVAEVEGEPGEVIGGGGDGDETEEMEEDVLDEDEEEDEEEEEEEEEGGNGEEEDEDEATQNSDHDGDEIDIDGDASDTAKRRKAGMHPDLDSGLESDSDGL
ncbi:conserved hypothetical protein [Histoplasma capsulatum var. duboisii H88]|uniref:DNA polymerase epsilon subunit D n=1 Tax=Ajellomyces capsulatus (strain H88) TaxID=544711 RepID=F0UB02_AJEC8|nr:conserved hypothetical protein [Histoplasma capsulatum var. duboisii H88]